jgi:hypothetical protein
MGKKDQIVQTTHAVSHTVAQYELAAAMEQLRVLQEKIRSLREQAEQQRQSWARAIIDAIVPALQEQDVIDAIAQMGGRVPVLLVLSDDGKVQAECTYKVLPNGPVVARSGRHGRVLVDGTEYPSLNAALVQHFPGRKIGTQAGLRALEKKGLSVQFLDQDK